MTTDIQILTILYKILNVPTLTDSISGEIWKISKPVGRELEDIVLNCLVNNSDINNHLNTGLINLNFYTTANADRTIKHAKNVQIIEKISDLLNMVHGEIQIGVLSMRFLSQKTFRDFDNPKMFYQNLKFSFTFKN